MQAFLELIKDFDESKVEEEGFGQIVEQAGYFVSKETISKEQITSLGQDIQKISKKFFQSSVTEFFNFSVNLMDRMVYSQFVANGKKFENAGKNISVLTQELLANQQQQQEKEKDEGMEIEQGGEKQKKKSYEIYDDIWAKENTLKNEISMFIFSQIITQDHKFVLLQVNEKLETISNIEKRILLLHIYLEILPFITMKHKFLNQVLPNILKNINQSVQKFNKYKEKYEGSDSMTLPVKTYSQNFEKWILNFLQESIDVLMNLNDIKLANNVAKEEKMGYIENLSMKQVNEILQNKEKLNDYGNKVSKHYIIQFFLDLLSGVIEAKHDSGAFSKEVVESFFEKSKSKFNQFIGSDQILIQMAVEQIQFSNFSQRQDNNMIREYEIGQKFNILSIVDILENFLVKRESQLLSKEHRLKTILTIYREFIKYNDHKQELKQLLLIQFTNIFNGKIDQEKSNEIEKPSEELSEQERLIERQKQAAKDAQRLKGVVWVGKYDNPNYFNVDLTPVLLNMLDSVGYSQDKILVQGFESAFMSLVKQFNQNATFQIFQKIFAEQYKNNSIIAYLLDIFKNYFCKNCVNFNSVNSKDSLYLQRKPMLKMFENLITLYLDEPLDEKSNIVQSVLCFYESFLRKYKYTLSNNVEILDEEHIFCTKKSHQQVLKNAVLESLKSVEQSIDLGFVQLKQQKNQFQRQFDKEKKYDQEEKQQVASQISKKEQQYQQIQFQVAMISEVIEEVKALFKN